LRSPTTNRLRWRSPPAAISSSSGRIICHWVGLVPKELNGKRIIGTIHSHNNMSTFHSGIDDKYNNYSVSIVVNNKLEFTAMVTDEVSCGALLRVKNVPVKLIFSDIELPMDRIKKKSYTSVKRVFRGGNVVSFLDTWD